MSEATAHDFADLQKRLAAFCCMVVPQAFIEGLQHRRQRLVQAQCHDEGKSKALAVALVEGLDPLHRGGIECHEAEAALFALGVRRHGARPRFLASQLRVAAQQGDLLGRIGVHDHVGHGTKEVFAIGKRLRPPGPLRHPGRVLHHRSQHFAKAGFVQGRQGGP